MTFRSLPYRLKLGFINRTIYWCGKLGAWALVTQLDMMGYPRSLSPRALRDLVEADIKQIGPRVQNLLTTPRKS